MSTHTPRPHQGLRLLRALLLAASVAAAIAAAASADTAGPVFWAAVTAFTGAYLAWYLTAPGLPFPVRGADGTGGWGIPPRAQAVGLTVGLAVAAVGAVAADDVGGRVLFTMAAGVAVLHVPTVLVGLALARAARAADPEEPEESAEATPGAAAAPGGAAAGWADGVDVYGPGYAWGTVYKRTATAWPDRPRGDLDTPIRCAPCGATAALDLVWPEHRPDLSLFHCATCGTAWRDPAWATADAVALVLAQDGDAEAHTTPAADTEPGLAYLGEMLRREAANGHRRRGADGA